MIRLIDIRLNAAHPELPLAEAVTYTGAPSTALISGVPGSCGKWGITSVSVSATYPDGSTTTRAAVQSANGVWVATLPATQTSGRTACGLRIIADGVDENGDAVTGYVLGIADFAVRVLGVAPAPAPGQTSYTMSYFDSAPNPAKKGDVAKIDGALKFYDGASWLTFADGATPIAPSTDPSAAGKPADAKATGDALAAKYQKPVSGIPKSDMDAAVQASLNKADSALRTAPVTSVNSKTGAVSLTASDVNALPLNGETPMTGLLETPGILIAANGKSFLVGIFAGKLVVANTTDGGVVNIPNVAGSDTLALLSDIPSVAGLAPLASPAFTGTPTAPTPTAGDNSTKVATTAFVQGSLRYDMPTAVALVAENDEATLVCADRAVTNATIAAGFSTLNLTFPDPVSGKVRDFYLRIVVAAGESAPALSIPQGITIENPEGAVPEIADGETSAASTTLVWFSETAPNVFTAKAETVKAVA